MSQERRRYTRHPTQRPAALYADGKWIDCRLRDIGRGGARVAVDLPVAYDLVTRIEIPPAGDYAVHVVWARSGDVGMAFEEPEERIIDLLLSLGRK